MDTPTLAAPPLGDATATTETVVTPEAPPARFDEMSKADRDSFLRDGKVPAAKDKAKSSDATADSSTAPGEGQKPGETAPSEKKAASEPAAPAKEKKARNSEENRVQELLEDRKRADRRIQELEARLSALDRPQADGKKDSSTKEQPSDPKWKAIAASKEFPKIEDFENPNEWAAAVHLHTQQQIESALSQRDQASTETIQQREVAQAAFTRGATEIEADPTILDRIHPELEALPAARVVRAAGHEPNPNHYIKDQILFESERPLALMAFYSTPEGQAEWGAMRGMDEKARQRTIIAREVQLKLGTTTTQGDATKEGEKKPAVVKTFTKSPAPPEKEGPKGAGATDGAESAVKAGNFADFQTEMDQRGDPAVRRYGRRRA